jgi:hypothetical protein
MQGRRVNVKAEIVIDGRVDQRKEWHQLDVMKLGQVRGWVRRQFNHALKRAGKDQQVAGNYFGQLKRPPYTMFSGELGGVNGRTLRSKGELSLYN